MLVLEEIEPDVVTNEELTTANEADALVKVVILVSSPVNLVDNEAESAANELEADTKVLEVASKFDVLMLKEPDAEAYDPDVIV
jgi:hypothetical protein